MTRIVRSMAVRLWKDVHALRKMFRYWDPEDHDLDAPMISPHLIPEGMIQTWDEIERKFVLGLRHSGNLGKNYFNVKKHG